MLPFLPLVVLPLALQLALVAPAPQRVIPGTQPPPVLAPPLPADTVEALLPSAERERLHKVIEGVVARSLKQPVAVETVALEGMREAVVRSLQATQPAATSVIDAKQIDLLAQKQIALYDVGSKTIFLGGAALATVGEGERPEVLRLMYMHVYIQAILDQELSMSQYTRADTAGAEGRIARRMASEGFVVAARDRVACRLGINPTSIAYRAFLPGSPDISGTQSQLERSVYGTGRVVIESRWVSEGIDAVWSFLASKPSSVRELAAGIPRSKAIRLTQEALDRTLLPQQWKRSRAPSAPSTAIAGLKGLSLAQRILLSEGCIVVDTLGYTGTDRGNILVSSLRAKDDASAQRLMEAIQRVPAVLQADFDAAQTKVSVDERTVDMNGVAVRFTTIAPAENSGNLPPTRIVDAMVGREILSVSITNARLSQEELEAAIRVAIEHLGQPPERGVADKAGVDQAMPESVPSKPAERDPLSR